MNRMRLVFMLLAVIYTTSLVQAQPFSVLFIESDQILTEACLGGGPDPNAPPIADGSFVYIMWDSNGNGRDAADHLAVLCDLPPTCETGPGGTVNYNSFEMNGEEMLEQPGLFVPEQAFQCALNLTQPPRFYLRVCGTNVHYESEVMVLVPGPAEIEINTWYCIEGPCPGCQAPPSPTNVQASDSTRCDGVLITYSYPDTTSQVDSIEVFRAGAKIGAVALSAPDEFLDATAPAGQTLNYEVSARRVCGADTARSPRVGNPGSRYPSPPVADSVSASSDRCDTVLVRFRYATNSGVTRFVVFRGVDSVGNVAVSGIPGFRTFSHRTTDPAPAQYYVRGWNPVCTFGDPSVSATGQALTAPAQVQNVVASDSLCNIIRITWADVSGETGYRIYRDGTLVISVGANVMQYDYTPPQTDVTYGMSVRAFNACGDGLISVADSGRALGVPPVVTNVAASDSAFCDWVLITWTDVVRETGYTIRRGTQDIGTVGPDVTSFTDTSAVPGTVYTYQVKAFNTCGDGPLSAGNPGSRKAIPGQVTGVLATDNLCPEVTVTWNNVAGEDSFLVKRNGQPLAYVGANILIYHDISAVPEEIYSYTVTAVNNCGTGLESAADNGRRREALIQVTGLAASDTSCFAVYLQWNDVFGEDSFRVFRGGTFIGFTPANDTDYVDLVAPQGASTYRVAAANTCGSGALSDSAVGTRIAGQPDIVAGVQASDSGCDSIRVTWLNLPNEDGFYVFRNGAQVGDVGADVLEYIDRPAPGTYAYAVRAYNECGQGEISLPDSGRRLTVPGPVTGVAASDTLCAGVRVTWNNLPGETGFHVLRNGQTVGTVPQDTLNYLDATAVEWTTYSYTVVAFNTCGDGQASTADNGTRRGTPSRVDTVNATSNRCDTVVVSWSVGLNAENYRVLRDGNPLGTVPAATRTYRDVPPDTLIHNYTIISFTGCGDGPVSPAASGRRLPGPNPPVNLVASDTLCGRVVVTWASGGGNVDSFRVYRGTTRIRTVGPNVFTWTDTVATPQRYTVTAWANEVGCGESAPSAPDSGRPRAGAGVPGNVAATDALCNQVTVTWSASTGEVQHYRIFRDGTFLGTSVALSFSDTTVNDRYRHAYRVSAQSPYCGESAQSTADSGSTRALLVMCDFPDTVFCDSTYRICFNHCPGVTTDIIQLSINGGAYSTIQTISPVQDTVAVHIPDTNEVEYPNCRIRVISQRGTRSDTTFSDPFRIDCNLPVTLRESGIIPDNFYLDQNFPNPFNPSTNIRFGVPRVAPVTIEVYDITGRQVATVIDGIMQPGWHTVVWDCSQCPSGMYLIRMQTGDGVLMRKMLLMK